MSFDKEEYWARRNNKYEVKEEGSDEVITIDAPMRGQKDMTTEPKLVAVSSIKEISYGNKIFYMNRKQRRTRRVNRLFCKKNHRYGVKIKHVKR